MTNAPLIAVGGENLIDYVNRDGVATAFPGHGELISDHRAIIDRQLARIDMRKQETYKLVSAGKSTLSEITEVMYGHYPEAARFTGLSTILGYTDLLIAEGKLKRTTKDGVWHFSTI